jgi:uncharacterized protein (TIGR04255 family)
MENNIKKPYKHAPLIMVAADISYSEIPNFDKAFDLEGLRESLFKVGLTEKVELKHNGVEIELNNPNKLKQDKNVTHIKTQNISRTHWVLLNNERTTALHILNDKIILKVTDYDTFDTFSILLKQCISAFADSISLLKEAPLKRVGLRYVDLIVPKVEDDICDYINSDWHAPKSITSTSDSRKLMLNRITQVYLENTVKVKVESLQFVPKNGVNIAVIPEDLSDDDKVALKLKLPPWINEAMEQKNSYCILDVDASLDEGLGKFNDGIFNNIKELKKAIRASFNGYVTSKAKDEWNN